MKKSLWMLMAFCTLNIGSFAQELPMPSPSATLTQRVGLTDVTIRYSRPSMKDREIFGNVVPFDELWRAGANMCTRISFSNDVMFADTKVKAGTYSVFFIPKNPEWTFILNSDTTLRGTSGYDSLKDVLRVNVDAMPAQMLQETMTFDINQIRDTGATIVMSWAEMITQIPFSVNDKALAMKNIKAAIKALKEGEYRPYMNAASYLMRVNEGKSALEYIDRAIEINDYWYAHWIRAQVLASMERFADATEAGDKALMKGSEAYAKEGKEFTYIEVIGPFLEEWRTK